MFRKQIFSTFAAIMLWIASLTAQSSARTSFITDSLDRYIQQAMTSWEVPGVAVAIVKDGNIVLAKGYGAREIGKTDAVDEHTLFMIGSNTKAFTGTALAMLEAEGKCTLNDKVQQWLPNFTMKDPLVTKETNLTDILTHRLGFETFQGDFMYFGSDLTKAQVIEKMGKLTPKYGFRAQFGYCNAAYLVAGECVQAISGKSWEDFLQERIFTPLQMNETSASANNMVQSKNAAKAHTRLHGKISAIPYDLVENLAPAGSISSSAADLSHWMLAQLNNGQYNGAEVIPANAIQRTHQPQIVAGSARHPFNRTHFKLYGLGWFLDDYEGRAMVSHTGGIDGFVTSVTLLPEENLGVVVLTNSDENAIFETIKYEIIDAYLGLPYRDYSQMMYERGYKPRRDFLDTQEKNLRDSAAMNLQTEMPLQAYTGRYENDVYGYLDIKHDGNKLIMTFQHHSDLKATLQSLGANNFLCTYSKPILGMRVLPFHTDGKRVTGMTLSVADFVEFTTYEFVKK